MWARRLWGGSGSSSLVCRSALDARPGVALRRGPSRICQALGIGIAVGVLAGAAGMDGRARGAMTLLAAALGLVAGGVSSLRRGRERRRRRVSPACSAAALGCGRDQRRRRRRRAARGEAPGRLGFDRRARRPGVAGLSILLPPLALAAALAGCSGWRSRGGGARSASTRACASCGERAAQSSSSPTSTRCAPTCWSGPSRKAGRRPSRSCSSAACWSPTASPASPR